MRQVGFVDNVTAGVERVKQSTSSTEGFAFIAEATQVNVSIMVYFSSLPFTDKLMVQVKYAVLTDPCNLQEIGEEFSRKPYALAVQKGSPLKDMLSERQV